MNTCTRKTATPVEHEKVNMPWHFDSAIHCIVRGLLPHWRHSFVHPLNLLSPISPRRLIHRQNNVASKHNDLLFGNWWRETDVWSQGQSVDLFINLRGNPDWLLAMSFALLSCAALLVAAVILAPESLGPVGPTFPERTLLRPETHRPSAHPHRGPRLWVLALEDCFLILVFLFVTVSSAYVKVRGGTLLVWSGWTWSGKMRIW